MSVIIRLVVFMQFLLCAKCISVSSENLQQFTNKSAYQMHELRFYGIVLNADYHLLDMC